ncbi:MAG: TRAP-type C4-dicarboxylate transport system permease small subunit [Candidatus Azotimanducaceae bacterium]|jgi:TRAP-type C4-dicarboxylate transport system permease small subunit
MRWIDRISVFVGESVGFFYLAAAAITVFEVMMRYVFNSPTEWAHELTILLCALGYLLSAGYVTQRQTHIRITALYDILPGRVRWYLDLFAIVFGFVVIALLVYAAWGKGLRAIDVWERTGSSWDPPLFAIVKPAIVIGAALFCLQLISNLVKLLRRYHSVPIASVNPPQPSA